ncbi:MAG: HAMP domain-containing histidine kinase [Muribaculaceae bacterium]|nr:HAMP domain-containing histidine kinase [Muribaculaceae bacterium]
MIIADIAIILTAITIIVVRNYRHQCLLRDRARLMRDAMRHRDFSFRLPTKGLLFGERELQDTMNNMGHEIEKLIAHNEVESWQRLTRVLTHEIMNATTPVMSISQAYLKDPNIKNTPYEEGFQVIYDTSTGLVSFVNGFRKMTQLQQPTMKELSLYEFCRSFTSLYENLKWEIDIPSSIMLNADENMLRQVFINLIKNAIEADSKKIGIRYVDNKSVLLISNDGHVIPDDVAREIFIPFFTTKQSGSGIGLSLSRQMLLVQGLILRLAEYPIKGYNVTFILEKDKL